MTKVFISYRRDDAGDTAGRLADTLRKLPQVKDVFLDVESIPFGADFVEKINHVLKECDYCLILLGPRWHGPRDDGPPRIMDEGDFVRMEVSAVLKDDMKVIPLLLRDANMPSAESLPPDLQDLPRLNAFPVRTQFFAQDLDILFDNMFGQNRLKPGASTVAKLARFGLGGLFGGLAAMALLFAGVFILKLATGQSLSAFFGYSNEATAIFMLLVPILGIALGAWMRRR